MKIKINDKVVYDRYGALEQANKVLSEAETCDVTVAMGENHLSCHTVKSLSELINFLDKTIDN